MSVRPILVVGAGGMLGQAYQRLLSTRELPFVALSRADLDVATGHGLQRVSGSQLVINCAAYTNVDGAEADEAAATETNGVGVGRLAHACREAGVPLIHFSTDYVFDGQAEAPYPVDTTRAPLGAYGRSKALGEELLESSGVEYLLVRTSWLYAAWGKNFARTMASLLQSRDQVQVVADQKGRPTEALGLAETALDLFDAGARGAFHATDGGEATWFEFATAIGRVIGAKAEVVPCTTLDFPRPAPRPPYSVLGIAETERVLGRTLVHYEARLLTLRAALQSSSG